MLGLKCHLITDLLLETNEVPHTPHKLQYFPNEETKCQRGEEKFLCHSEQLTESGWEGTPNGQTPGLAVSTPNLFLFFFSRGALGILESCSCPTLQHRDCVWCSSFSS